MRTNLFSDVLDFLTECEGTTYVFWVLANRRFQLGLTSLGGSGNYLLLSR